MLRCPNIFLMVDEKMLPAIVRTVGCSPDHDSIAPAGQQSFRPIDMVETKKIVSGHGQIEKNVLWRDIMSDGCERGRGKFSFQRCGDEENESDEEENGRP